MTVFHKTRIGQALLWFTFTAVYFTVLFYYLMEDGFILPLARGVVIGGGFGLIVFLLFNWESRTQQW